MLRRTLVAALTIVSLLLPAASISHSTHRLAAFVDLSSLRQVPRAYSPERVAAAYGYTPLLAQGIDGSGETVALIEIDALDRDALQQFDAAYSLPAPNITEYEAGSHGFRKGKSVETTADVEWLHALAPGATIQIYYVDNNQPMWSAWRAMASALRTAASRGVSVVSISLGACGPDLGSATASSAFAELRQRGVTVFVSSGDSGDRPGPEKDCGKKIGVAYPSGDPSVVSVGGTSLQLTATT